MLRGEPQLQIAETQETVLEMHAFCFDLLAFVKCDQKMGLYIMLPYVATPLSTDAMLSDLTSHHIRIQDVQVCGHKLVHELKYPQGRCEPDRAHLFVQLIYAQD